MTTSSIEPASGGLSTGLQLRSDLVVTPVRSPRGDRYVIEDPHAAQFYHVGPAEYAFLTRLDGKTAIDKVLNGRDPANPRLALSSEQAHALCQWASNARLLCCSQTADPILAVRADEQAQSRARWARTNPFYLRVPLVHPDRFMASAQRVCGWLFSPAATAALMIVWLVAAIQLWRHANAFATTLETLFSPGRPVALILAWIVLKVLHEIGHGIVCRRYGGEVREAGLIFLLLAPVAYVDVTSSWRFRSKWRRIHTSAAGIYVELSIAALAALLWSWLGTGAFTDILANIVIMAGVTTLAFNLNPLMRFDGYYILADLLEINNLYDLSRRHLRYLAKHHLLGVRVAPAPMPPGRSWVVKVYAVASACWRVVVVVGLLAAAAALFHGAGIVLAAIGVLLWIVAPASRFIVYLIRGSEVEKPRLLRFAAIVAGCSVVVAGLLAFSPTLPASAPGIVEYSPPVVVRALSPGFVARLHVGEGEFVTAGTLLARLANDTLDVELAKLQSSLEQAEHRARRFYQRQQMSEYAQERSTIESLAKRLEEKRAQVEALDVVAPASGTVIRRRLATLEGTYLARGDELLTLGNEQAKRVTISLNQNQAEPLMAGSEAAATIFISGQKPWSCAIRRLLPGASLTPPDPSLCAPNGGPIAARRMENNEFQFLTPRFIATVELPADLSRRLRSGQRCTIVLDQMRIGLAEGLWRWCQSVFQRFYEPGGA